MVAESRINSEVGKGTEGEATESPPTGKERDGLSQLFAAAHKVVDIQVRMWLARFKLTALKVGIFCAVFGAAGVLGILAIVFLYIGLFHVLTDVVHLQKVWAYLIFGGVHAGIAAGLMWYGVHTLAGKKKKGTA